MATTYERLKAAAEADDMDDVKPDDVKPDDTNQDDAGIQSSDTNDTMRADDSEVPDKKDDDVASLKQRIEYLERQLSEENSQTYKARWSTLNGMFAAEKARHKAEVEELKRNPAPAITADPKDYDELVEEQGEKTAKILKPYLDTIASLQEQISNVAGDVKTAKEKTAYIEHSQAARDEDRFFRSLEREMPDWKKINGWDEEGIPQDPRFKQFAYSVIPGTNITYQDALEDNYRKRDAQKVAEIYSLFQKTLDVSTKKPTTSAAERFIEPEKTGKGVKAPNTSDSYVSHVDYEKFVDSIKKGTFKGTREERVRLEEFYDKAFNDNRIR